MYIRRSFSLALQNLFAMEYLDDAVDDNEDSGASVSKTILVIFESKAAKAKLGISIFDSKSKSIMLAEVLV